MIVASDANEILKRGDVELFDVRSNDEFNARRIPGAINLPLSAIESLAETNAKQILLCGSGLDDAKIMGELERLNGKRARPIMLLRGGVRNWIQWGGDTVGYRADRMLESAIVVGSVTHITDCTKVILVDEDEEFTPIEVAALKDCKILKKSRFQYGLRKIVREIDGGAVVVMTHDGRNYSDLQFEYRPGVALFCFDGGYRKYLDFQISANGDVNPKKVAIMSRVMDGPGGLNRGIGGRCVPCDRLSSR